MTSIALILTATLALTAQAQSTQLPQINVIGQSDQELLSTPSSASFVEQEEIKRKQPLSPQEAVSTTPGVHTVDTEGHGFLPRIGIRGLNPDMSKKVLLLEDGVPINLGPYTDPASYYSPTLDRMQRVEVLKGSSSLRYGPSTIGGTVNYVTKDPRDVRNGFSVFGGSRRHRGMLVEGAKTSENSAASVTLGRKAGEGNRDNSKFDITDLVIKYGMALSDAHYVGAKFGYFSNDLGATYLGLTEAMFRANPYQNPARHDQLEIERIGFDLNHEWNISQSLLLKTLFYGNTTKRNWWRENFTLVNGNTEIQMSGNNAGRLRSFRNLGIDSRLSWKHNLFDLDNETEFGVRIHDEEMDNQRVDGTTATARSGTIREEDKRLAAAQAAYLLHTFRIGALALTPAARVEHYRQERRIFRNANADVNQTNRTKNTEVMPGFGAVYAFNPSTSAYFGIHKGFSPPRVQDVIDTAGGTVQLDAERSTNMEVGVRRKARDLSFDLALFQLDFKNQLIQASEAGGATSQLTNAGRSLHRGLEAGGEAALYGPLYLGLSWTHVATARLNSQRVIDGQNRQGNRLPYAPKNIASMALGLAASAWSSELQLQHTSEQFTDFENTGTPTPDGRRGVIPSYTIVNLAGRVQVARSYELFGTVKNLADKAYISSRAPQGIFPGLQRTFVLGLNGSF
jgi:Fe(3+) dicitrate transport protein